MTELELYKFINDNSIEIDWRGENLYVWIPFYRLEEFTELLGCDNFAEGGEDVYLQYDCICIDLVDVCDRYDIDHNNILERDPNG